jgi:hypothetical protein
MSSVALKNQEDVLAILASSMSTALIANDQGELTAHEGCRETSETSLRMLQLSPTLAPNQSFCAVPSLSLRKRGHTSSRLTKAPVEQAAAMNLAESLKASQNDVHLLPSRLVHNVSESFMLLVDSRFRSYLAALAHQSRKDPNTFAPLLKIFSAMSARPVSISTIVNTFRVVENSTKTIQENRIVPSLIQETVIDLDILGESLTVVVAGVGVVHGVFESSPSLGISLVSATILINMNDLLQSMVAQARHAVKVAKDRISQLYLLSLSQKDVTADDSRHAPADQTQPQLPLHLNPDIAGGHDGATQSLSHARTNNMHAMSPPPRRVSVNCAPRTSNNIKEEESSKARLGDDDDTKRSIHKRRVPVNSAPRTSNGIKEEESYEARLGDDDDTKGNIHARRVPVNSTPRTSNGIKEEESYKARLGDDEDIKGSIHCHKITGLDLLTRAAKCLKVPSDRVMPASQKHTTVKKESDTDGWGEESLPGVAEV